MLLIFLLPEGNNTNHHEQRLLQAITLKHILDLQCSGNRYVIELLKLILVKVVIIFITYRGYVYLKCLWVLILVPWTFVVPKNLQCVCLLCFVFFCSEVEVSFCLLYSSGLGVCHVEAIPSKFVVYFLNAKAFIQFDLISNCDSII